MRLQAEADAVMRLNIQVNEVAKAEALAVQQRRTDEEREEIHHLFEMRLGLNTVPQFGLERKRIPWATLEREMDDPESPLLAAFGAQLIARLADCGFQGDKPS